MKILDLTKRSARSLKNAKMRTALTALAIAVGSMTLTLTLSAGNGIRAYTDRLVSSNFDPAAIIVGRDEKIANSAFGSQPQEYDSSVGSFTVGGNGGSVQIKRVVNSDIDKLKKYSFVDDVRPFYQISALYITSAGQKKYTLSLNAYNPGQKPELRAGSIPSGGPAKGTVILPDDYLKLLNFSSASDAIGKSVTISLSQPFSEAAVKESFAKAVQQAASGAKTATPQTSATTKEYTFTVDAVSKKSSTTLSAGGLPVYLGNEDSKELYDFTKKGTPDEGKYLYAFVRVKDGKTAGKPEEAKKQLEKDGYYAQTAADIQATITQLVNVLQYLFIVFGVITIIASIFGIINTMYIAVLERTREIGLMKALGMHGLDIGWLFRLEAGWIGLFGASIGIAGAWGIITVANPPLQKLLDLGKGNYILIIDWWQVLGLIGGLTLIAILSAWLPARKAAKLDPIEALRTE